MGLKLTQQETEYELSEVKVDISQSQKTVFQLTNSDREIEIEFQFPIGIQQIPSQNTSRVFVFKNQFFRTNDIFKFRIERQNAQMMNGQASENGEIGIIFSLEALLDENTFDEDNSPPFSNIYAFTALEIILKNLARISLSPLNLIANYDLTYSLRDLYDNDIIFLVLNEDLLKANFEFYIEEYLCELWKLGFYSADRHNLTEIPFNNCELIATSYTNAVDNNKVIKVKASSSFIDILSSQSYYHVLIKKLLYQKSDAITKFVILYQVIELLKDRVLKKEIENLLNNRLEYSGYQLRGRVNDLKDAELIRKLLSSNYTAYSNDINAFLIQNINAFLHPILSTTLETLHQTIYELRNNLLHNFSAIPQSTISFERLQAINELFEYFIFELIISFNEPEN